MAGETTGDYYFFQIPSSCQFNTFYWKAISVIQQIPFFRFLWASLQEVASIRWRMHLRSHHVAHCVEIIVCVPAALLAIIGLLFTQRWRWPNHQHGSCPASFMQVRIKKYCSIKKCLKFLMHKLTNWQMASLNQSSLFNEAWQFNPHCSAMLLNAQIMDVILFFVTAKVCL